MDRTNRTYNRRKPLLIILSHALGVGFFVGQDILVMIALGTTITPSGCFAFAVEIAAFYINLRWVLPLIFEQKQQLVFILRLVVLIVTFIIVRSSISYPTFVEEGFFAFMVSPHNLLFTIWRLNYPMAYSFLLGIYWQFRQRKNELHLAQLTAANADARAARLENAMIQLRLNPHLLLSTLEHVYASVEQIAPDTATAIGKLIDITRYRFENMDSIEAIPVIEELKQVEQHIAVKQLLAGNKLHIRYNNSITSGSEQRITLPPGILLTLTDNVLTHSKLKDVATPAVITATINDNHFCFITTNHKAMHRKPGNGTGLKSVRSVLENYFPGRHELLVHGTAETFTLQLIIKL